MRTLGWAAAAALGLLGGLSGCTDTTCANGCVDAAGADLTPPPWSRWTVLRAPQGEDQNLWAVWGVGPDHFYAVGVGGAITEASPEPPPPDGPAPLAADGKPRLRFQPLTSPTKQDLTAIHGTGPSEIYAVGGGGTLLRFDGTAWTQEQPKLAAMAPPFTADLWGVYAYSGGAMAVGKSGAWARRAAGVWQVGAPLAVESLAAAYGTAANNIYAAGSAGYIFRFDGSSWSLQQPGFSFTTKLAGIFGDGMNTLYFVGLTGSILRKTGGFVDYAAGLDPRCGRDPLPRVFFRRGIVAPDGQVVLVGWEGAVVRLGTGPCKGDLGLQGVGVWNESGATQQRLEGVWSYTAAGATTVYVVGAGGVVLRGTL